MAGSGRAAEGPAPLVLERTIALKGVTGRIDHLAVDLARKRLFVAELGNGTVDVIDLASGTVIRRIEGLKEPQGLGYAPAADILAVASAGDGSVRLFHGAELSPAGTVNLANDADNIRLDTRTGNLVVGYGSGGLAVIDPAKAAVLSRIPLQAHPEGFQLDPANRRAFVNVPDARQVVVVDMDAGRQTASWRMPDLRANFPMALDAARSTVAVVFRNPARLVIFDVTTGKPTSTVMTCGDASGARTSLFVPDLDPKSTSRAGLLPVPWDLWSIKAQWRAQSAGRSTRMAASDPRPKNPARAATNSRSRRTIPQAMRLKHMGQAAQKSQAT